MINYADSANKEHCKPLEKWKERDGTYLLGS